MRKTLLCLILLACATTARADSLIAGCATPTQVLEAIETAMTPGGGEYNYSVSNSTGWVDAGNLSVLVPAFMNPGGATLNYVIVDFYVDAYGMFGLTDIDCPCPTMPSSWDVFAIESGFAYANGPGGIHVLTHVTSLAQTSQTMYSCDTPEAWIAQMSPHHTADDTSSVAAYDGVGESNVKFTWNIGAALDDPIFVPTTGMADCVEDYYVFSAIINWTAKITYYYDLD